MRAIAEVPGSTWELHSVCNLIKRECRASRLCSSHHSYVVNKWTHESCWAKPNLNVWLAALHSATPPALQVDAIELQRHQVVNPAAVNEGDLL